MTEPSAPAPASDYVTHQALEQMLRNVLMDVVSEGALIKMVNTAVDNRVENMRTLISSIDAANRTNFQDFKELGGEFKVTANSIQSTMALISERMARTETGQESDRKRISDIVQRVDVHEKELDELRQQLTRMETTQNDLRVDIHGDANHANRPSIFSQLTAMDTKLDAKFSRIETSISGIKETQDRHEQYIARRQSIETWVLQTLKGLWKNQVSRFALLTGLPLIGTLFVAAADPKVADAIAKFISALLTGK